MPTTDDRALPPRLRIVVMGNSTAMYVRPRRTSREDGNYGELLERQLRQRGIDAVVYNEGRWWERVHEAMARWEEAVHAHTPDVVVLNYGMGECQPNLLPTPVLRWLTTWRPSLHPVSGVVRRLTDVIAYRFLEWFMPRASRRVGMRTWRLRPKRYSAELRRLIRFTRQETGALVLVLTPNPPGPLLRNLMPGLEQRSRRYEELTRQAVAKFDDGCVRVVDAGQVVERLGWRKAMVDGLHYTPRGHREVAALLEEEIVRWLDEACPP